MFEIRHLDKRLLQKAFATTVTRSQKTGAGSNSEEHQE